MRLFRGLAAFLTTVVVGGVVIGVCLAALIPSLGVITSATDWAVRRCGLTLPCRSSGRKIGPVGMPGVCISWRARIEKVSALIGKAHGHGIEPC